MKFLENIRLKDLSILEILSISSIQSDKFVSPIIPKKSSKSTGMKTLPTNQEQGKIIKQEKRKPKVSNDITPLLDHIPSLQSIKFDFSIIPSKSQENTGNINSKLPMNQQQHQREKIMEQKELKCKNIVHSDQKNHFQLNQRIFAVKVIALNVFALFLFSWLAQTFGMKGKICVFIISSCTLWGCFLFMLKPSNIPMEAYDPDHGTWFGHRMSSMGEWNHIPTVLLATYSFVFSYGSFVSIIDPPTHILMIPLFYVAGLLVFYIWHVAAHTLEGTELRRLHMVHHLNDYPSHDFYGDKSEDVQNRRQSRNYKPHTIWSLMNPMNSTTNSIAHEGPIVLAILIIIALSKFVLGVSKPTCAFAFFGFLFMAMFGSAIHMSFHERNFQLEPYAWYRELRSLHMIHHMQHKNYAMVNILIDIIFGSLLISE